MARACSPPPRKNQSETSYCTETCCNNLCKLCRNSNQERKRTTCVSTNYLPTCLPTYPSIYLFIYLFIYLVTKSIYLSNPLINLSINPSIYPCVLVSMYTSIHPAIAVSLSLSHCLSVRPSVRGQTAMNIRRSPISDCSIAQCMIAFNMNKSDCVFLVLQGEPGTPVAPS